MKFAPELHEVTDEDHLKGIKYKECIDDGNS